MLAVRSSIICLSADGAQHRVSKPGMRASLLAFAFAITPLIGCTNTATHWRCCDNSCVVISQTPYHEGPQDFISISPSTYLRKCA
jgi:hypothetical protein